MPQFCKCRSHEYDFHTSGLCHDQHTIVDSDVRMRLALQVFGQEPKSWHFRAANVNTLCWTKALVQPLLNAIYFVPIGKVVSMESRYFPENPKHWRKIFGSVNSDCLNFTLASNISTKSRQTTKTMAVTNRTMVFVKKKQINEALTLKF